MPVKRILGQLHNIHSESRISVTEVEH